MERVIASNLKDSQRHSTILFFSPFSHSSSTLTLPPLSPPPLVASLPSGCPREARVHSWHQERERAWWMKRAGFSLLHPPPSPCPSLSSPSCPPRYLDTCIDTFPSSPSPLVVPSPSGGDAQSTRGTRGRESMGEEESRGLPPPPFPSLTLISSSLS